MTLPSRDHEFQRLFRTHRDAVWAYCVRRIPYGEVEDAVAEVFAVAWRRRTSIPSSEGALPWLYGVARNVVRNTNRSRVRRSRLGAKMYSLGTDHVEGADVPVIRNAEDEALLAAVAALPEEDRELLRLRLWEELTIADISRIVGRSPRGVESRLTRIRRRLSRDLDGLTSSRQSTRRSPDEGGEAR